MTDSASPDKEHNLETTIGNRIAAFTYLMAQPILSQTFEYPLEEDAFNIYSSPLGQKLAALTLSNLPLSADGKALPKEVVASEAKETAVMLEAILSKPVDLDILLTGLSDRSQALIKENYRKCREGGLRLEQMLESFRVFLENVAREVRITTNTAFSLSDQDRMMIMLYLQMGWFLGVVVTSTVSCGGEGKSRLQSYQRVEYEAVVEYVMGHYAWGGDRNKAAKLLRDNLGPELDRERRRKGQKIPGSRYRGTGLRNEYEPQNDEFEEITIGLYKGLLWTTNRNLVNILPDVPTGKLRNSLKLVGMHNLINAIRKANKQLGIKVPPDLNEWSAEGKTEDEIQKRVNQDLEALSPKEVPDFEVRGDEESTSKLKLASDKETCKQYFEDEAEGNRQALIKEEINLYKEMAKLTSRLKLVANLWDEDDTTIAVRLEEAFGKPVKPGAVRAQRTRVLNRIRDVITEK